MAICILASGTKTKHMVMESTTIATEQLMKANGRKINSMERGRSYGRMALSMSALILRGKSMVMENFSGLMAVPTKGSSIRMKSMGMAFINGTMGGNMKDNGIRIKCTDMEFLRGRTDALMMASTTWIKRRGMECFNGPMAGSIEAVGRTESRMAKALILIRTGSRKWAFGIMERGRNGWMILSKKRNEKTKKQKKFQKNKFFFFFFFQ